LFFLKKRSTQKMQKRVKMGIEIEYLMMTEQGGPIYSGWRQERISHCLGLQILLDAASFLQPGIQRQSDDAGHLNVYRFHDGKIMLPDTYTLLETVTSPNTNLDILRDQLWEMKRALIHAAQRHSKSIVSGSACPIAYRYDEMNRVGMTTANNAGMHVHLEAPNDKIKIKLCNMIMQIMPELTALGVNSPIYAKKPAGICSQRLKNSPLVGPSGVSPMEYNPSNPLQFNDPGNRYRYITPYTKSRRTIELRGFDTPMTIDWAMAIAALIQCLAVKASNLFVEERRNTVVGNSAKIRKQNYNSAMTHGLKASFLPDHTFGVRLDGKRRSMSFLYHNKEIPKNQAIPAVLAIKRLLYYIEAQAHELGLFQYLEPFYEAICTGKDQAQMQLEWFNQSGYNGFFSRLKEESQRPPTNHSAAPGKSLQYFTVRERGKGTNIQKAYLAPGGFGKLRARPGDLLVISGPSGSVRLQVDQDFSTSDTIALANDEIRLGQKFRNRLGISMYDPVIVGRETAIPNIIKRTGPAWISGAIK
jgi:gamma-glutamyl:cysteine ligase YbdK (ATP-grasp superfamily)